MSRSFARRSWRWITELTLTALFWAAWLYLIMPLLSLLLWFFGYRLFHEEMLVRGGYEALLAELGHYGLVTLAILLAVLLWMRWNMRHYGDHNKRTHQPMPVQTAELADYAGLRPVQVSQLQATGHARVTFDEHDRLVIRDLS